LKRAVMIGLVRKLWRRHRVKAAERRLYLDQEHSSGHGADDAERIVIEHSTEHRLL
jgi:hypothetical protein